MIGPHERKELDLMLAGKKSLAVFHDLLIEGEQISEEIIPELRFAPYVAKNQIKRFAKIITNKRNDDKIKFVTFTLPDEEWRAHFYLWLEEGIFSKELQYNPAHDELIGKLLGYSDADIKDFLDQKN